MVCMLANGWQDTFWCDPSYNAFLHVLLVGCVLFGSMPESVNCNVTPGKTQLHFFVYVYACVLTIERLNVFNAFTLSIYTYTTGRRSTSRNLWCLVGPIL
jgi:hypothetical protein